MTYIPFLANPDADKTQSTLGVPANLNVNTQIPCTAVTHTGITNSNGQLVISSGLSVLLTASAFIDRRTTYTGGYMVFQWYDVTNSAWIGKDCQISTATWDSNTHRYKSESFARCVLITTSQITVELRIKSILNCTTINEAYDGSSIPSSSWPSPWYSILSF
jgi:hypothetical protein